ncbi:MAG: DMT family transporter [Gammaproteobacteria bacterium]|nr:DMT family transporter [Gammaproteobacteria bacterium]
MSNESKGMLLGILGVIFFGLTLPATRYIITYFDPIFIGLGRAVVASFFALLLLYFTKQPIPNKNQISKLIVISIGVVIGFPVLSAWAMQTVPASHGGVVLGVLPLATAIVGVLISNERPSIGFWITGIVGSSIVVVYSLFYGVGSFHAGDIALFGAVISASIGYAIGGQLSKEIGGWQVICWALVISLPFIIVPAWIQGPKEIINIPINIWVGFLYLALVSQLLGFFLWNNGLALGGIARVSQTQLIQPFVTIVASSLLVNEVLDITTIVFALLVVSTVAVGKRMPINEKA